MKELRQNKFFFTIMIFQGNEDFEKFKNKLRKIDNTRPYKYITQFIHV